jgi:hypothetical protein
MATVERAMRLITEKAALDNENGGSKPSQNGSVSGRGIS